MADLGGGLTHVLKQVRDQEFRVPRLFFRHFDGNAPWPEDVRHAGQSTVPRLERVEPVGTEGNEQDPGDGHVPDGSYGRESHDAVFLGFQGPILTGPPLPINPHDDHQDVAARAVAKPSWTCCIGANRVSPGKAWALISFAGSC